MCNTLLLPAAVSAIKAVGAFRLKRERSSAVCVLQDHVVGFVRLQFCHRQEVWMACYAWSHQNSEYMHFPHDAVCDWGSIDLHGSSHPAGVQLLTVVPPFPTSFLLWLLNSTRELLSACIPLEMNMRAGCEKPFPAKMPLRFIKFKYATFSFDRFLVRNSSMSQTSLHLFYNYRVHQQQVEPDRHLKFYQR